MEDSSVFMDSLIRELKEYFPNNVALQNFCNIIIKIHDNYEYSLSDIDRDVLKKSIKDLSIFTTLGIYQKVFSKMSDDIGSKIDIITRKSGGNMSAPVKSRETVTTYTSNRVNLGIDLEELNKRSNKFKDTKNSINKEYVSSSNQFSLDGVDLDSSKSDNTSHSYATYHNAVDDSYDSVPDIDINDLDY